MLGTKNNLYKALFNLKKELGSVKKTSTNPYFSSKYADLAAHLDLVEPLFEKHGLLLLQPAQAFGQGTLVTTSIIHVETGEREDSSIEIPTSLTDAQKICAAITYFRRASLNAILGMKSEDSDGEDVVGRGKTKTTSNGKLDTKSSFSNGTTKAF